jgi:hypothetical protein
MNPIAMKMLAQARMEDIRRDAEHAQLARSGGPLGACQTHPGPAPRSGGARPRSGACGVALGPNGRPTPATRVR